ncbi:MAG: energy-coupling factor transporter ATPase [Anaerolineae bacterium]|nr:energy-coupling factor transporter ATPase [Anaerolineae bacterium]
MTMPMIEARGLRHTYLAGTPLAQVSLRGVDVHVNREQVVAFIGATGSGKSTLLQHMNGLLRPQAGRVSVLGHDLSDPATDLRQIRRAVGLVFQRPEDQVFEQYVGDDVAYGPRRMGLSRPELRERVRWAMDLVGLDFEHYVDRLTSTLSGGERRRVGLAGVLAMRPRVLLLDEPTAGLDPCAREELLARLSGLHEQGMALAIASHNMDDVAALADRVYVLEEGRVALHGPTREVFAQVDRLRALGLDVPAPVEITFSLAARGLDIQQSVLTLDEAESAILQALSETRRWAGKDPSQLACVGNAGGTPQEDPS